jgi:large subunit ribosomal protein L18
VYAQLIDDGQGVTLAAASSLEPELKGQLPAGTGNGEAAKLVGATIAERAKAKGIEKVVFDRGGYVYHGKVKQLAEAAREKGLQF